jgi:hypothetical protein
MTVSYSTLLKLNNIVTGTEEGTWGDITNTNICTLIEQAIAGAASVNVGAGNVTLSDTDGASNQARCMIIGVSGSPGVSRNIVAPNRSKAYVVANGSNASVVLKTSTSTGLTIPSGEVYMCYYDTGVSDFVYVGQSATSANTANKLVLRDASGNFSAGTITANLTGNVTGQLDGSITSATTAVTQAVADDSSKVATTAFVQDVIAAAVALLGTMASQNANNVNITGGTITATFTGNLTGNVTGDVSGNAGTVTNGVYTTNFTGSNQSLVANGYQKLPGGLILQWGTYTSSSDDPQSFSFPTSFTTSCLFVVATFINVNGFPVPVTAKTTTQFTVDRSNSVDNNQDFMMFALGY